MFVIKSWIGRVNWDGVKEYAGVYSWSAHPHDKSISGSMVASIAFRASEKVMEKIQKAKHFFHVKPLAEPAFA